MTTTITDLKAALDAAQQATDTQQWQAAAKHATNAARLARTLATQTATPRPATPPTAQPDADTQAIADHLRSLPTVTDGQVYLNSLGLSKSQLLAVLAALGRIRVGTMTKTQLANAIVQQAIGAHRKFAGLRKW